MHTHSHTHTHTHKDRLTLWLTGISLLSLPVLLVFGGSFAVGQLTPVLCRTRPCLPLTFVSLGFNTPMRTATSVTTTNTTATTTTILLFLTLGLLHLSAEFARHLMHPFQFRRFKTMMVRVLLSLLLLLPHLVKAVGLQGFGGWLGGDSSVPGHANVRAGASKEGAGLCPHLILAAQREELKDIVGLEEAALLWVFQHAVGEELFEDLPVAKHFILIKKTNKILLTCVTSFNLYAKEAGKKEDTYTHICPIP